MGANRSNDSEAVSGTFARWLSVTLREGAWAPALVVGLHVVAMVGFDAYRRLPWLDIVMHFIGGAAIALFLARASVNGSRFGFLGPFHRATHVLLAGSLTCVAAVVWEWAEFAVDQALGTSHQPGVGDTMADLMLGCAGGAAFLLAESSFRARNRK